MRIEQKRDSLRGWFCCTSDEFGDFREGWLPGFAVVEMLDLKISDSTITFYADPRGVTFMSRPFPLDYKSNAEAMAADTAKYKRWSFNSIAESYDTVHYAGRFYGDSISINNKYYWDGSHTFAKVSEQEVRSRIGKIDYRFVPENTEGEESWIKEGEELDCENVAGAVSEALLEIDMTYYYFQANGEGGKPSYGDCLLRLKKRADGTYKGWYYGNTDDCTPPRTKGCPGFFVKPLENLTVRDGKISFTVTFADTYFLNRPSPVENRTNIFSLDNSMGNAGKHAPCPHFRRVHRHIRHGRYNTRFHGRHTRPQTLRKNHERRSRKPHEQHRHDVRDRQHKPQGVHRRATPHKANAKRNRLRNDRIVCPANKPLPFRTTAPAMRIFFVPIPRPAVRLPPRPAGNATRAAPLTQNRSSGFVKLRAYAWQIALRPAEGVAGYGKAGREDR